MRAYLDQMDGLLESNLEPLETNLEPFESNVEILNYT
jgi:hypothetical protein